MRLLDSLLVRVDETERARSEVADAERRLAYLTAQQTTEGRDQLKREREQAVLRFTKSLVENERLSQHDAALRAKATLGQLWAETDRRVVEEGAALRARLALNVAT